MSPPVSVKPSGPSSQTSKSPSEEREALLTDQNLVGDGRWQDNSFQKQHLKLYFALGAIDDFMKGKIAEAKLRTKVEAWLVSTDFASGANKDFYESVLNKTRRTLTSFQNPENMLRAKHILNILPKEKEEPSTGTGSQFLKNEKSTSPEFLTPIGLNSGKKAFFEDKRLTLKLFGAGIWMHDEPPGSTGPIDRKIRVLGGGFGFGLSLIGRKKGPSLYLDFDIAFSLGKGPIEKVFTATDDLTPRKRNFRGGGDSIRSRVGYGSEHLGIYILPPLGTFDFYWGDGSFMGLSYPLNMGMGAYFGDRLFFVEASFAKLDFRGTAYEVRFGMEVLNLFRSSPKKPSRKGERPENTEPTTPPIIITPVSPEPPKVENKVSNITVPQDILFDYDSAEIKASSYPSLDAIAKILISSPEIKEVEIQGHADDRGSGEYNLSLSTKRAKAVAAYLNKKGIDSNRLIPKGYGKSQPVVKGNSEEARAKNRRVEFIILKKVDE